jgi:RNA polymerase sigma-70 factor (ECF subfamily)
VGRGQLTALDGLTGKDAAHRLQIPVAHVFVARNRVQKLLQEEIRIMEGIRIMKGDGA